MENGPLACLFFVVTKLEHAYYRMGGHALKSHQVSSIAFLCRALNQRKFSDSAN